MEEKYPCPKMTPRQWVANFWYYNKWFFILGVVVFVFLLIPTVQYFTKDKADASILCVGAESIHESTCKKIILSAESFIPDVNGDGVKSVDIETIRLYSDLSQLSQPERTKADEDYREYSDEILGGDACFLLLDEYFYQELAENGTLVNLYKIFDEMPKGAFDYYGIRLGDCPLYKLEGFSKLSPELVLCLKYTSPLADMTDEERAIRDVENLSVFRSFYDGKAAE